MYVDGWNFYGALVDAGIKPYGWCNFPLLARQQTFMADAEVAVKYFTSADRPHEEKIAHRQRPIWWRALKFIGCHIIEGEFRSIGENSFGRPVQSAGTGLASSFWGTCAGERFPSVGSRCQEYERCHKAASAPGSCARTIAENR